MAGKPLRLASDPDDDSRLQLRSGSPTVTQIQGTSIRSQGAGCDHERCIRHDVKRQKGRPMFRQIDNAVAFSAVMLMLSLIVTAVTSLNRGATSAALNTSASTAIASPPLSMIA
jgi:hypothetical protein